ncbi:LysR substrate-binding domain-containing protein [Hoeflea olei]|uniref:LysR family transcriptional regulator n=1 Tax=Hoeflea olei TaxID=1480615 RepID=A0A1C1YX87_9HYPH|nr:LysR substrate-binding domain-containing protein [Hoeflea olei]OCW58163.1 LysR family transcriptional regulator [Hoeflea olei]
MTLPVSFSALRAFVEVGRHGSIKRAASELNVTPGAVSQQIKALEAQFGIQLLKRGNREVKLTPQGLRLFGMIAPGFEQIDTAVQAFYDRRPNLRSLVISTTPALASCWLAPRFGGFTAQHPQIEIRVDSSVDLTDLKRGPVDIAIRHGSGDYPGLDTALLHRPSLVAVASPRLVRDGPLAAPLDCLRYPLLQDRDRVDWTTWFQALGARPGRTATKGPSYADDNLLIQGAVAGQGLAVVRDIYAADALQSGRIVLAFEAAVPTKEGYFVVVDPDKLTVPKIAAFRQWILREAGRA